MQGAYSLLTTALQIQLPFLLESRFIGVTFGKQLAPAAEMGITQGSYFSGSSRIDLRFMTNFSAAVRRSFNLVNPAEQANRASRPRCLMVMDRADG
jgi:hypothetical protein